MSLVGVCLFRRVLSCDLVCFDEFCVEGIIVKIPANKSAHAFMSSCLPMLVPAATFLVMCLLVVGITPTICEFH